MGGNFRRVDDAEDSDSSFSDVGYEFDNFVRELFECEPPYGSYYSPFLLARVYLQRHNIRGAGIYPSPARDETRSMISLSQECPGSMDASY